MMELFLERIITSVIIVAITLVIYFIIKAIVGKIFNASVKRTKHKKSITIIKVINNIIKAVVIILSILTIISVWGVDTKALIASLGIVGLVAGLAVQDTLKDVIAGASIIFENEFDVGDNIQIGTFRGDVIDISLQTTTIKAYTGEIKIISNGNITEVINYSRYPIKTIIDFGIAYDTDPKLVESLMNIATEKINELPNLKGKAEFLGVEQLADSSVVYRIVADCKPGQEFACKRAALKIVKEECDRLKIDIPFNQVVVHNAK